MPICCFYNCMRDNTRYIVGPRGPQGPQGPRGFSGIGNAVGVRGTGGVTAGGVIPVALTGATPNTTITAGVNSLNLPAGTYLINYGFQFTPTTAGTVSIGLTLNGTPVTGSTISAYAGEDETANASNSLLITVPTNAILRLVNTGTDVSYDFVSATVQKLA